MNRTERLQQVLRLEGIAAAARSRAAVFRAELEQDAIAELDREGAAPTWRMPELGTVVLPTSKEEAYVADPEAFLAWVKERHPEQVRTVEQVHAAYQRTLLATALLDEDAVLEPGTGEQIPGLVARPAGVPRSLTIRPSAEAKAVFAAAAEAWLDGLG